MRFFISIFFTIIFSFGCANRSVQKKVKQEVANEPVIKNDTTLYSMDNDLLNQNKNLTPNQKEKLHALFIKSRVQNEDFDREIIKTKSVLFKSLMSSKTNMSEIDALETQLIRLNRKKTRFSIASFREAQEIVGKENVSLEPTLQFIEHNNSIQNL